MSRPLILLLLPVLVAAGLVSAPNPVHADGWIHVERRPHRPIRPPHPHWPRPPREVWGNLKVTRHWVDVAIDAGFARVSVDETFHSDHPVQVEGTYYFPLPPGAHIEDFRATLGGKELAGEILPRDKARRIYEGLVRRVHDPALLEYYDRDLFRARIFPIPARGDVVVKISYRQTLKRDGGFTRFRYPLDTGRFSAGPYENVKISVDLKTDATIRSVTSPSHPIDITKTRPRHAQISFEAAKHPANQDFLLDYLTANEGLAGGVRAFQESGEDGYFTVRLAPGEDLPPDPPEVTLLLVIDTSGSMAGKKIQNAREALLAALSRLRPKDHFQILTFASSVRSFSEAPIAGTADNVARAREFVQGLTARGGTDIGSALTRALEQATQAAGNPTVLLVSDGAPTVGITDPRTIVKTIADRNRGDFRVHIFGVGHDVNTHLLDDLARKNGGSRSYLDGADGTEGLEVAVSGMVDKVTVPCLTDLRVFVETIGRTEAPVRIDRFEPVGPHDLFFGEDLVIAGRYTGHGAVRIRIEGESGGVRRAFVFPADFPRHGGREEAAYVWAQYRIDGLLDALRLKPSAPEQHAIKKEIVDLGLRFGMVTPYTSYLVQEDQSRALSRRIRGRLGRAPAAARREMELREQGFLDQSGSASFNYSKKKSDDLKSLKDRGSVYGLTAGAPQSELEATLSITRAGGKAFIPSNGMNVEGAFQGGELPQPDVTLVFGTDEYLTFLRTNPGVSTVLANSRSLLFRWKEQVIRIEYDATKIPDAEPEPTPEPAKPEPKREVF